MFINYIKLIIKDLYNKLTLELKLIHNNNSVKKYIIKWIIKKEIVKQDEYYI
jgi:hypothetical protein